MDRVPVVLTGRLGASAWRLAGARVRVTAGADCAAAFDEACEASPLVLVDEAVAAWLPPARLAAARRGHRPLVLVVPAPDGEGTTAASTPDAGATGSRGTRPERVPDVVDVVRRTLGVAP